MHFDISTSGTHNGFYNQSDEFGDKIYECIEKVGIENIHGGFSLSRHFIHPIKDCNKDKMRIFDQDYNIDNTHIQESSVWNHQSNYLWTLNYVIQSILIQNEFITLL